MLHRTLQVLDAFGPATPLLNLTQISSRCDMPISTAHRLVKLLVAENILTEHESGFYSLGLRLWEIASRTPSAQILREIALPFLQKVQHHVNQHTQLGVLIDDEVVFLERLSAADSVINYTVVGGRLPLNASSSGILLLAYSSAENRQEILNRRKGKFVSYTSSTPTQSEEVRRIMNKIRQEGFIVAPGWIHAAATGIAVPVRDHKEQVVASLSLVVPNDGRPTLPLVRFLQQVANEFSTQLSNQDHYVMDKRLIDMMAKEVTILPPVTDKDQS